MTGDRDLTERAYRRISTMILHQELRSGERTSVPRLAAAIGIGRGPVKSAVERLAAEGLVQVRGRSGTYVAQLDRDSVEQLFEMRTLYEEAAAPMIIERMTGEQFDSIAQLVPQLSKTKNGAQSETDTTSLVDFIDIDVQFHKLVIAAANNRYLMDGYSRLNLHFLISHYLILDGGKHTSQRHREHEAIMAALSARDPAALAQTLREHTEGVFQAIHDTMRRLDGSASGS
ncbi:MAG: GntR family transcriptional regulator [Nocardioidaceae bacterium]